MILFVPFILSTHPHKQRHLTRPQSPHDNKRGSSSPNKKERTKREKGKKERKMAFSMMVRRMSAVGVKASGSPKKVAVIMSGSGFQDGSEIHETVAVLFHISNNEATYDCFAPDAPQSEVVNHLSGTSSSSETRNVLTESARIARGKIEPLSKLSAQNYDALFVPGGFVLFFLFFSSRCLRI